MKVEDTLKEHVETWDDPGDYPSGAGAGPLRSYDYVGDIEGEIEIKLTAGDLQRIFELLQENGLLYDAIDHVPELEFHSHIKEWNIDVVGDKGASVGTIELTVKDFEGGDVPKRGRRNYDI